MSRLRALPAALALVLVVACATGSAVALSDTVMCRYSWGGGVSLDCGDPRTEAAILARWPTADQANEMGCPELAAAPASPYEPGAALDPPSEPPLPPRATDPAVTARVNAAWDTIERWLAAHASVTLHQLAPPATPRDVDRLERYFGRKIPDALYASLMRHDGAAGNFGAGFQLPLDIGLAGSSSYSTLHSYNCMYLGLGGSVEEADTWHGSLLPFASGGGGDLFIDPRTGRVGRKYGLRIRYDDPMSWPSYLDLLEGVAAALESGGPLRQWYPTVTAGCELRWSARPATSPPPACADPTNQGSSRSGARRPAGRPA